MSSTKRFYCQSFYPLELLHQAVFDYRALAKIQIEKATAGCYCIFSACIMDAELIANEFDNYLIELRNHHSYDYS